jgi:hypothetical protein
MTPGVWRLIDVSRSGVLGLIFLSAGVSKVLRPRAVRRVVRGYDVLPARAVGPVSRALGPVEIVTGILLAVAPLIRAGRAARTLAWVELVLFSGVIGSALHRGIRIPCGCGPIVGDHMIGRSTLIRNLVFAGVLVLPIGRQPRSLVR